MKLWGAFMDVETVAATLPPEPVLTDSFIDSHAFELGGRRFELYSTPGGETTDALVVWMPEHRTVFIGNLMGPFFGHVPNLYTLRGDKIRSAMAFIHSVDRVIALGPETLDQRPRRVPRRRPDRDDHDQGARRDRLPARSHHRRHELRRRPVDVDARGHAAAGAGAAPGARQGAVDRAGDLGGARRAGSATSPPPSSTTSTVVGLADVVESGRRHRRAHRTRRMPTPRRAARCRRCT